MNIDPIFYSTLDLSSTWIKVLNKVRDIPGVIAVYPSGSRYIGGYTKDSDLDIVVFAQDKSGMLEAGYEPHQGTYTKVRSYRKGLVNLIVHDSPEEWLRTVAATELCRVHGVSTKDARYSIHEIVKGENE